MNSSLRLPTAKPLLRNGELTGKGRLVWLAGALMVGVASQWCMTYGLFAAPL